MKIYFCDKCHESIPLKDIKTNRITIDAGKIYCQGCAPKPTRSSRSVNLLTFVIGMVVCLAGGMAVAALWGEGLLGRSEADDMPGRMA